MKILIRAILLAGSISVAFADHNSVSPDMPRQTANGLVDVIVRFKTTAIQNNNNNNNNNNQHGEHDDAVNKVGQWGWVQKDFKATNAVHISLPLALVTAFQKNPKIAPFIDYMIPNRKMKRSLDISTQSVNANLVWPSGYDGTGVGVAVIDSGVSSKADLMAKNNLGSRIVYSESFVAGLDANDQFGHGTHVAGIIGANGKASTGTGFTRSFKGVAPNANIINLRVLDANGSGNESDVIAAIERAIALKNIYNIRVINLSLGHPIYESYVLDPLCQAVEAAWNAGIVVVTAAGNYGRSNAKGTRGYGTIASPGNDPYVITVGAMNAKGTPYITDDIAASYSSKGPTLIDHIVKPDLVAPGNGVVSLLASPTCTLALLAPKSLIADTLYQSGPVPGKSKDYFQLSGTSMATPVVAGAAALMLQKNPYLSPDQVKARLMKTARKSMQLYSKAVDANDSNNTFDQQSDIFTVGAGYVDINAALANADLTLLPALSPTATYDPRSKHVSVVINQAVIWGDAIVWGESIVWGPNVFLNASAIVWGEAIVWGDTSTLGFAIVWGDSPDFASAMQALSDDDGDQ